MGVVSAAVLLHELLAERTSLVVLALQNALLSIILHYSRIYTPPDETYSAAAAVFLTELLKGAATLLFALHEAQQAVSATTQDRPTDAPDLSEPVPSPGWLQAVSSAAIWTRLRDEVLTKDSWKMGIPAVLYVIQNNLQYLAASNLDLATFQVSYQMKILTTAFFSVILLGKRLDKGKWAALLLLAAGVGVVQVQSVTGDAHASASGKVMYPIRGFIAVSVACLTSGLAGVYFELQIKSPSASPGLWIRNTQLCAFSIALAAFPIVLAPNGEIPRSWVERVSEQFRHLNGWAVGTIVTQAVGGLLTAVVIRYADNIL